MIKINQTTARRIAIHRQRLAGPQPPATREGLKDVMQDIRCLQIDPIRAVERTQYLVLFSRLGTYPTELLGQLAYEEKYLFEYWAHAASYVLAEDYPLHRYRMENFDYGNGVASTRYKDWLASNHKLRSHILETVRKNGKTLNAEIEDITAKDWGSTGWTSGRNTTMMISNLWHHGDLMVADRDGNKKYWDLPERVLGEDFLERKMVPEEIVYHAAQLSLRALGVGTPKHIKNHFIRNRYPDLEQTINRLQEEGLFIPVQIEGNKGAAWNEAGDWFIHQEDLPLVETLQGSGWAPRTTLLSPFDNLICDRERTELIWDFFYRIEIYVPKNKRQYGYYVLPILHGDRLIGRIDSIMDRKGKVLQVNAVYAEEGAPRTAAAVRSIRAALDDLARFLGAQRLDFDGPIPDGWRKLTA